MLRACISRVEHGHVTPTIESLEKIASALELPLYRRFYDGKKTPKMPNPFKRNSFDDAP